MFAQWSLRLPNKNRKTSSSSRRGSTHKRCTQKFAAWGKDSLDLHQLFEAGGNDPEARTAVFDIVERLVREGMLKEEGNDFYSLTAKGRLAAQQIQGET
jgi:hypothetical protein